MKGKTFPDILFISIIFYTVFPKRTNSIFRFFSICTFYTIVVVTNTMALHSGRTHTASLYGEMGIQQGSDPLYC